MIFRDPFAARLKLGRLAQIVSGAGHGGQALGQNASGRLNGDYDHKQGHAVDEHGEFDGHCCLP